MQNLIKPRLFLLFLLAFVLTDARLYFRKGGRVEVTWLDISAGERASLVASNSYAEAVWVITKKRFGDGGYKLAYFDEMVNGWREDESQPIGAVQMKQNYLAVD